MPRTQWGILFYKPDETVDIALGQSQGRFTGDAADHIAQGTLQAVPISGISKMIMPGADFSCNRPLRLQNG